MDHLDRQMWIHVVIPVYNAKKYLKEAVDSVLGQPYRAIDIVLVDDGSTDGSSELCDEIARGCDRIHVIHQANGGISKARNAGIEYVLQRNKETGYFAFLDADDAWTDNVLDEQLDDILGKGYTMVGFQTCVCNENMTRCKSAAEIEPGLFYGGIGDIWISSNQHFGSLLYSMELFVAYNLRFQIVRFVEDKMLRLRAVYLADTVYQIEKTLYQYRMNNTSVVHSRPFGIDYYPELLDAYMELDADMARWQNDKRGVLKVGTACAMQYTLEMQQEHFRMGGSLRAFREFMDANPRYEQLFRQNDRLDDYYRMMNPTVIYRVVNYVRGWLWKKARLISKLPGICLLVDKIRYPLKIQ